MPHSLYDLMSLCSFVQVMAQSMSAVVNSLSALTQRFCDFEMNVTSTLESVQARRQRCWDMCACGLATVCLICRRVCFSWRVACSYWSLEVRKAPMALSPTRRGRRRR